LNNCHSNSIGKPHPGVEDIYSSDSEEDTRNMVIDDPSEEIPNRDESFNVHEGEDRDSPPASPEKF
jgi:hypothetical protein